MPTWPLSRRHFLEAGAIAAGYALSARPLSAETLHTPDEGLVAGDLRIPVDGRRIPGYRARPAGEGRFPLVLVVHEIFGVHEYIRDVCRRFAHAGYLAIAPDLYARYGDATGYTDIQELIRKLVARVPDAEVLSDLDHTVRFAGDAEPADVERLGITGFCWGGRVVWLYAAHSPALRAGVAWYGRLEGARGSRTPRHPLALASELRAPVLGLYGGLDHGIPPESVARMKGALERAGDASEIVVYPEAGHGFHADYRPSYQPEAARDAWKRALDWLTGHGAGPSA